MAKAYETQYIVTLSAVDESLLETLTGQNGVLGALNQIQQKIEQINKTPITIRTKIEDKEAKPSSGGSSSGGTGGISSGGGRPPKHNKRSLDTAEVNQVAAASKKIAKGYNELAGSIEKLKQVGKVSLGKDLGITAKTIGSLRDLGEASGNAGTGLEKVASALEGIGQAKGFSAVKNLGANLTNIRRVEGLGDAAIRAGTGLNEIANALQRMGDVKKIGPTITYTNKQIGKFISTLRHLDQKGTKALVGLETRLASIQQRINDTISKINALSTVGASKLEAFQQRQTKRSISQEQKQDLEKIKEATSAQAQELEKQYLSAMRNIQRQRFGRAMTIADMLGVKIDPRDYQHMFDFNVQLQAAREQVRKMLEQHKRTKQSLYSVIPLYDEMGNKVSQFAVMVDRAGRVIYNFDRDLIQLFQNMFYRMGVWAIATAGVYMFINAIKEAIQYMKDLSRQLKLLEIAAGGLNIGEIIEGIGRLVSEYGGTVAEAVDITYQFVKVLRDEEKALEATKLALMAYNISGLEYDESAELLIGVMNQYNLSIREARDLMDAWAVASRKGTVDFKELAEAFNKSAVAANELGISYKELTAMIEAVGTASGESGKEIGNFVKFILEHARDLETLYAVQEVAGVPVFTETGEYRSTFDVLVDLGKAWKDLSDDQRNYVKTAWASYRQGARFKALMEATSRDIEEFGSTLGILKEIHEGYGEAAYQNALVLNTLQGAFQKLQGVYTTFVQSFTDSGLAQLIKFAVKGLYTLLDLFNKTDDAGTHFLSLISAIITRIAIMARQGMGTLARSIGEFKDAMNSFARAQEVAGTQGAAAQEKIRSEIGVTNTALNHQIALVDRLIAGYRRLFGTEVPQTVKEATKDTEKIIPSRVFSPKTPVTPRQPVDLSYIPSPRKTTPSGIIVPGGISRDFVTSYDRKFNMGLIGRVQDRISKFSNAIRSSLDGIIVSMRNLGNKIPATLRKIDDSFAKALRSSNLFGDALLKIERGEIKAGRAGKTLTGIITTINTALTATTGVIGRLKFAIRGLMAAIPEILLLSLAFEAVYKGIEKIGEAWDKSVERRALYERNRVQAFAMAREDFHKMLAEGRKLYLMPEKERTLTKYEEEELRRLEEREKEGLTTSDEVRLEELRAKKRRQERFQEIRERTTLDLYEWGQHITPEDLMLMDEEEVDRLLDEYFKKLPQKVKEEIKVAKEKIKEEKALRLPLIDPAEISKYETEVNRFFDKINRRLKEYKNQLDYVRESYLGLGSSNEYYKTVLEELTQVQSVILDNYDETNMKLFQVQNKYNEATNALRDYEELLRRQGKDVESMWKKIYTGEIDDSDSDIKKLKEYYDAQQRYEALLVKAKQEQANLNKELVNTKKEMLDLVMSSNEYAGVWDSIQQRIKLVKQTLADLRNIRLTEGVGERIAEIGIEVFGRGWDKPTFLINRISGNIDKLFSNITKIEESLALFGDDQEKLREALDKVKFGEIGQQMKVAVTDPIIQQAKETLKVEERQEEVLKEIKEGIGDLTKTLTEEKFGEGSGKVELGALGWHDLREKTLSGERSITAIVKEYAQKYGDPRLFALTMGFISRESGFNPNAMNTKGEYSVGLGQINLQGAAGKRNISILKEVLKEQGIDLEQAKLAETGIFGKRASSVLYRGEKIKSWEEYLKDPEINIAVTMRRIKEDLERAGGDFIGLMRNYVGPKVPNEEIIRRAKEVNKYAGWELINIDELTKKLKYGNAEGRILAEAQESRKDLVNAEKESVKLLRENISELRQMLIYSLNTIPELAEVLEGLGNVWSGFSVSKAELYRRNIERAFDKIKDIPSLLTKGLEEALKGAVGEYYDAAIAEQEKQYQKEISLREKLITVDRSLAESHSTILENIKDKLIDLLRDAPLDKVDAILDKIREVYNEIVSAKKVELFENLFREIDVNSLLSGISPIFGIDLVNVVDSIKEDLVDLFKQHPDRRGEVENTLRAINDIATQVKYNTTYHVAEIGKVVRGLQRATIGTPEYYQLVENLRTRLENLYGLDKKINSLSEIFNQMAVELPEIYGQLADLRTKKANRDLITLFEQIEQVNEVFRDTTPLSMKYFAVQKDLVELEQRELDILNDRVSAAQKLFELTGQGLREFVTIAGQQREYRRALLENQRAQLINQILGGKFSGEEYQALLKELVSIEKQWMELITERRDLLTESFKLGIISLEEYISKLDELRDKNYDLRSSILDLRTTMETSIREAFKSALTGAFTGSLTAGTDFINSIKNSLAEAVSESITTSLLNNAGIKGLLDETLNEITESIYSGKLIDDDAIRDNLQQIINTLSGYLPAYRDLLSGIFETLENSVFNAPTGFKIEPYLYEFMKARGPEAFPGINLPPDYESGTTPLPLPENPPVEEVKVPKVPENPIRETLDLLFVGLDEKFRELTDRVSTYFDEVIETFDISNVISDILDRYGIKVDRGTDFQGALRQAFDKVLELKRTYMEAARRNDQTTMEAAHKSADEIRRKISEATGASISKINDLIGAGRSLYSISESTWNQLLELPEIKDAINNNASAIDSLKDALSNITINVSGSFGSVSTSGKGSGKSSGRSSGSSSSVPSSVLDKIRKNQDTWWAEYNKHKDTIDPGNPSTWTDAMKKAHEENEKLTSKYGLESGTTKRYHTGGRSPFEQLALLRPGEIVIPPDLVQFIDKVRGKAHYSFNNTPTENNFKVEVNVEVNGGNPADVTKAVEEGVQNAIRQIERENRMNNLRFRGVSYAY